MECPNVQSASYAYGVPESETSCHDSYHNLPDNTSQISTSRCVEDELEAGLPQSGLLDEEAAMARRRKITIRNTFIDIDNEAASPVVGRKRAETAPGFYDFSTDPLTGSETGSKVSDWDESGEEDDWSTGRLATLVEHLNHDSSTPVAFLAYQERRPPELHGISSPVGCSASATPGAYSRDTSSTSDDSSPSMVGFDAHSATNSKTSSMLSGNSTSSAAWPQHFQASTDVHTRGHILTSFEHGGSIDMVPLVGVCCMPVAVLPGIASASATAPRMQETSLVGLAPSIGSAGHFRNSCKPCAFGIERCKNGESCEFCHICRPVRSSKRGRWILKRRRLPQELQSDMLNLKHQMFNACE